MLLDGQSKRAVTLGLRYRYLTITLEVNTPGNSTIGEGGGIMMIAGLSGVFRSGRDNSDNHYCCLARAVGSDIS